MEENKKEISLEEYKKAYREMEKEGAKKGAFIHLAIYIVVNAILIFVDLSSSGELWFFWPLIGWGIGVIAHFFSLQSVEKEFKEKEAEAEKRARQSQSE